jgi:hypothetical protein
VKPELVDVKMNPFAPPPAPATNLVPSDDEAMQLQVFAGAPLTCIQVSPESVDMRIVSKNPSAATSSVPSDDDVTE